MRPYDGELVRKAPLIAARDMRDAIYSAFNTRFANPFKETGIMDIQKPDNVICEIKFGSHLYGTDTPQSDLDYKGIFMPTKEEILLGRIPKTFSHGGNEKKNAGDLDVEYYSFHHFVKLGTEGQTGVIDMIYAPDDMVWVNPEYQNLWDNLRSHRHRFLSKNMKAFVGYARSQASRYSLKGDRLRRLTEFRAVLTKTAAKYDPTFPLSTCWDELPRDDERTNPQGIREIQISGKWYGETSALSITMTSVGKLINRYGDRAQASTSGSDWKAMSHAVRVSRELKEILETGGLSFPLADASLILKIKQGKMTIREVETLLDEDLSYIELLMSNSSMPEKVDFKWWDNFLIEEVAKCL